MNDTTRELGGALGVAVLGSLVLSQFQSSISGSISGLPDQARNLADSGLAGALQAAQQLGGEVGRQLTAAAKDAYVTGMGMACTVAAIVALLAAGVVWRFLRAPARAQVPSAVSSTELEVDGLQATEA